MLSSTVAVQVRLMSTFAALPLITDGINVTVKVGASKERIKSIQLAVHLLLTIIVTV